MLAQELRQQIGDGHVVQIGERNLRVADETRVRQHEQLGFAAVLVDELDEAARFLERGPNGPGGVPGPSPGGYT